VGTPFEVLVVMPIVLFEDALVDKLDPVALGKPAFAIACASYRLVDLLEAIGQPMATCVRPHLRDVVAADYPQLANRVPESSEPTLWVNARLVPSIAALAQLQGLLASGRGGIVRCGPATSAAVLVSGTKFEPPMDASMAADAFTSLGLPTADAELPLFEYPHDIIRHHLKEIGGSLEQRIATGEYRQLADGIFAAEGAQLGQYAVADTRRGPIVLERGATIGPYCYLSGPVHVGASARVLEHAALKDGVVIGHTAKIGGEVEASIIEPYTNKQHHGFLGHSYLGSWINLGAGTCNSDLKNTYGAVNMEYRGQKVPTGMQFVGAIVGDYAKTAINTGIFTGKTIGVCSMVYGFVTTNVPSFVNYARLFGQVTEAPVEVMVATQRRMFERRGVAQRPCDVELLKAMYGLTIHERMQSGEALSLEPLSL
jgi:UDP-N-acetylglucosamine diphosphorylase/glucosamine-1-phosphate N-acetyltransferase